MWDLQWIFQNFLRFLGIFTDFLRFQWIYTGFGIFLFSTEHFWTYLMVNSFEFLVHPHWKTRQNIDRKWRSCNNVLVCLHLETCWNIDRKQCFCVNNVSDFAQNFDGKHCFHDNNVSQFPQGLIEQTDVLICIHSDSPDKPINGFFLVKRALVGINELYSFPIRCPKNFTPTC